MLADVAQHRQIAPLNNCNTKPLWLFRKDKFLHTGSRQKQTTRASVSPSAYVRLTHMQAGAGGCWRSWMKSVAPPAEPVSERKSTATPRFTWRAGQPISARQLVIAGSAWRTPGGHVREPIVEYNRPQKVRQKSNVEQ